MLVVGAGPTGLVLALWLTHLGVRCRIIDKTDRAGTTSRALAVQARTLELYQQIGLADAVVQAGRKVIAVNLWVGARHKARAVFGEMGAGVSPYPFALIFPQDEHEALLIDRLAAMGVTVERQTALEGFEEVGDVVRARLSTPQNTETCVANYVAGCDGAHSVVRTTLGIEFPGGTYEHVFYVADVEASGAATNGDIHVDFDRADFLAVFPLKRDGHIRLVGTVMPGARPHQDLTWDDVSKAAIERMQIDVARVNWFSTYRVHHRVANSFRGGRAFLAGDAAHIHSPVGGQGMNTGIGDAINLAWKLAAVIQGRAAASLLDSYEPERIAFARRLVATTDRAFTGVTSSTAAARFFRMDLLPAVMPPLVGVPTVRRLLFRTVSQTLVNYHGSPLSEGVAAGVRGGDRLPWVADAAAGSDSFAVLTSLDWQVHVYGKPPAAMTAFCAERRLPLHRFDWSAGAAAAGLERDAAYLIRPDGYVGSAGAAVEALASYLDARQIVSRVPA